MSHDLRFVGKDHPIHDADEKVTGRLTNVAGGALLAASGEALAD